jgi:hypothetical protein
MFIFIEIISKGLKTTSFLLYFLKLAYINTNKMLLKYNVLINRFKLEITNQNVNLLGWVKFLLEKFNFIHKLL